jgi:predicted ATPase
MTTAYNARNFLLQLTLLRHKIAEPGTFPFTIPAIAGLDEMTFKHPVTFLIGENGAGKSTLLRAIAIASGLNCASPAAPAARRTVFSSAPKVISTWQRRLKRWTVSQPQHRQSSTPTAANPCTNNRTANPSSPCS